MNEENNQETPDTSEVDVEATPSPATDETEVIPPLEEAPDESPEEDAAEEKEKKPRKKKIAIIAGCCAAAVAVFAISALVGYNLMHVGTVKATVNAENWNSETDTQAIVYVYEGDQAEVLGNDYKADDPEPVAEQFVIPNEETVLSGIDSQGIYTVAVAGVPVYDDGTKLKQPDAQVISVGSSDATVVFDLEVDDADDQETVETEIEFSIEASDWNEDSSAAIAHVTGKDADGNEVDFYHAFQASDEKHSLTLNSGTYEVEWISPINSDGSIYTAPEKANLLVPTVSKDTADPDKVSTTSKFEKVPAENVSSDDLNKILDSINSAIEKGDDTLTGDAGTAVADKAAENASKNGNADTAAVEEKKAATEQKANETKDNGSKATTSTPSSSASSSASSSGSASSSAGSSSNKSSSSSGSSSSGSSSSSSASSSTTHTHSRTPVYKTVHHDAVYYTYSVCNVCGQKSPDTEHMKQHRINDGVMGRTYSETVLQTPAYDEQVVDHYKCSICGAEPV